MSLFVSESLFSKVTSHESRLFFKESDIERNSEEQKSEFPTLAES